MKNTMRAAGAALALAVGLTGCSALNEAQSTMDQAQQKVDDAQAYLERMQQDVGHLTEFSVQDLQDFDFGRLVEYAGTYLGDNSTVIEFMRSMPSGQDIESFQIQGDQGKLTVNYGDQALEADPAVLQQTMEEVAAQAKEHVQNLKTVEFRVGEKTYTF